jgi:chaperone required for assembly of F1-ATPase
MHTSFAKFHEETKTTKASRLHWIFCHKPHDHYSNAKMDIVNAIVARNSEEMTIDSFQSDIVTFRASWALCLVKHAISL